MCQVYGEVRRVGSEISKESEGRLGVKTGTRWMQSCGKPFGIDS